ncbi:MAG: EamA family transporter [Chloroflexi bacterium]|nr:EamA family transporter [Chloroflexota bacterium]
MPAKPTSGALLVLTASVLWGTTGTAQTFAPPGVSPMAVGAARMVIGGLALVLWALVKGGWRGGPRWPVLPTLLATLGVAAYQLLFFAGVARTGVAVGTIVGIGSSPILSGLLTWLIWRQWPGARWLAATGLALLGCTLLVLSGGGNVQVNVWGICLALGAGLSYAIFTMAGKILLAERPSHSVTGVVFGLGALLLLPLWWRLDMGWLAEPRGILVGLHLGVVTMAVAYLLFTHGLRRVSAATAVSLTLAEPLTAGLAGIFVVGEQLGPAAWLGMGVLLAGLLVLTWQGR